MSELSDYSLEFCSSTSFLKYLLRSLLRVSLSLTLEIGTVRGVAMHFLTSFALTSFFLIVLVFGEYLAVFFNCYRDYTETHTLMSFRHIQGCVLISSIVGL